MTIDETGLKLLMETVWEQRVAMNYLYVVVDIFFIVLCAVGVIYSWIYYGKHRRQEQELLDQGWVFAAWWARWVLLIPIAAISICVIARLLYPEQAVVKDILYMVTRGGGT